MSGETRTFRPFLVDVVLSKVLDGATFAYGDLMCASGGRLVVEDASYSMREPVLAWSRADRFDEFKREIELGALNMGIHLSCLSLVVVAKSAYLKLSELVYQRSLDDLGSVEREVKIGVRPDGSRRCMFHTETHGATIHAYIALNTQINADTSGCAQSGSDGSGIGGNGGISGIGDSGSGSGSSDGSSGNKMAMAESGLRTQQPSPPQQPPQQNLQPLRPSLRSTWLAQVKFNIACRVSEANIFRFTPLDDANRRRLGIDKHATRFVEIESGDLTDAMSRSNMPTFWVDEQLLHMLDSLSGSPLAKLQQLQLAVDFISAVVFEFSQQCRYLGGAPGAPTATAAQMPLSYDDIKTSIVGKIVNLVAGPKATRDEREQVLKSCVEDPRKVVVWLESSLKLREKLFESLKSHATS